MAISVEENERMREWEKERISQMRVSVIIYVWISIVLYKKGMNVGIHGLDCAYFTWQTLVRVVALTMEN